MKNAKQEIVKRAPQYIRDRLHFVLPNGASPFRDPPASPKEAPVPMDLRGMYRTDYVNIFGHTDPDDSSTTDGTAATIMKAIAFPSNNFKQAFSQGQFAPDFLNAVAAACAVTSLEWDIRGKVLGDMYRSYNFANQDLADCVTLLLAIHIKQENGGIRPISPRQIAKGKLNVTNLAARLSKTYADFRFYYQTLKSEKESLDHIADFEADPPSAELTPTRRPDKKFPPKELV